MNQQSGLSRWLLRQERKLPRPVIVLRQQTAYWPAVLLHATVPALSGSFFINGFPSSGTNWLCQLTSRYFGLPIFEPWTRFTPPLRPHVFHLHRFVTTEQARRHTLYITRDGRDAIVSRYFKLKPNPNDLRPLKAFEKFSGLTFDAEQVREQLPAFIDWYFSEKQLASATWAEHIRAAVAAGFPRLTFEGLKTQPVETLAPVFEQVSGEPCDRSRLKEVVDSLDFSKMRTEESSHHKRKSQVGEWRSLFTRESREVFARHAQAELETMGYESDRSWIEQGGTD